MSVEFADPDDVLKGYDVECPHCGEEFSVQGGYPEYCVLCGERLEEEPDVSTNVPKKRKEA
jgi:uncharacterized protein (DUF983 family)